MKSVVFFGTADGIPRLRAGRLAALACHRHAIHSRSLRIPLIQFKIPVPLMGYRDFGTADGIRTHDLQSRSLALYPAELQPHMP